MISPRHAPVICVVLALALIPTLIHSYAGVVVSDGLETSAIGTSLEGFTSTPTKRSADWGMRRFESDDWFERRYVAGSESVALTVVRSYDLKSLYHHPELAVSYHEAGFLQSRVETFDRAPGIPVHVLTRDADGGPLGLYALHYEGEFIANPFIFQLRAAGELLFTGRRAMTLFFVLDDSVPAGADFATLPAANILFAAIREFVDSGGAAR